MEREHMTMNFIFYSRNTLEFKVFTFSHFVVLLYRLKKYLHGIEWWYKNMHGKFKYFMFIESLPKLTLLIIPKSEIYW